MHTLDRVRSIPVELDDGVQNRKGSSLRKALSIKSISTLNRADEG